MSNDTLGATMLRTLIGFAVFAVLAWLALKLVFGLLGFAFTLVIQLLWLAAVGFLFYLLLKVISPSTARRVRNAIRGEDRAA